MTTTAARSPIDRLDGIGFPTKRDEAWRYAPHRLLGELTFGASVAPPEALDLDLDARLPGLDGPRLVVVNGAVDHDRSVLPAVDGVAVSALVAAPADAARVHTERPDDEISDAYMALELAYGLSLIHI